MDIKRKIHWDIYTSEKGGGLVNYNLTKSFFKEVAAVKQRVVQDIIDECDRKKLCDPEASISHKMAKVVQNRMYTRMDKLVDYGARDTEPECVLCEQIEIEFGVKNFSR